MARVRLAWTKGVFGGEVVPVVEEGVLGAEEGVPVLHEMVFYAQLVVDFVVEEEVVLVVQAEVTLVA